MCIKNYTQNTPTLIIMVIIISILLYAQNVCAGATYAGGLITVPDDGDKPYTLEEIAEDINNESIIDYDNTTSSVILNASMTIAVGSEIQIMNETLKIISNAITQNYFQVRGEINMTNSTIVGQGSNSSYVLFDGVNSILNITNSTFRKLGTNVWTRYGVWVREVENPYFYNCTFTQNYIGFYNLVDNLTFIGGKVYNNSQEGMNNVKGMNTTIDGTEVYNNGKQGIAVAGDGATIKNCVIYNNTLEGIVLSANAINVTIINNIFFDHNNTNRAGIYIQEANNTLVKGNTFWGNYESLRVFNSDVATNRFNNTFINNEIINGTFHGFFIRNALNTTVINNTIHGVNFLSGADDGYGIALFNTNYTTIQNNTFYNNHRIMILSASNFSVIRNNIGYNHTFYGISMYGGSISNTIDNNTFYNFTNMSQSIGIYLSSGNNLNNTFTNNTVYKSYRGFRIYSAINTTLKNNTIYNNTRDLEFLSGAAPDIYNQNYPSFSFSAYYYSNSSPTYYFDNQRAIINYTFNVNTNYSFINISGTNGEWHNLSELYNLIIKPSSGVVNVTVNSYNLSLPVGQTLVNFTANTTDGINVNFTQCDLTAGSKYLIRKNNNYFVTKTADSQGCIWFDNSVWSSADFTITQTRSDGSTCSNDGECTGGYCVHDYCRSTSTYCGDGYCDSGECSVCMSDCGPCGLEQAIPPPRSIHSWNMMVENKTYKMLIDNRAVAFMQIDIELKNSTGYVEITVSLISEPETVISAGDVYQYVQVTHNINREDIKSARIVFDVNKSWLSSRSLNTSDVQLWRYEKEWQELLVKETNEYNKTIEYEAETPWFSIFAITAQANTSVTLPEESVCGNGVRDEGEECDGADLSGNSCSSLGYIDGVLSCGDDCIFNTTECIDTLCGNQVCEPGEEETCPTDCETSVHVWPYVLVIAVILIISIFFLKRV